MSGLLLRITLGFVPVLIFATALLLLDNYKLVKFSAVLEALLVGCLVAVFCLFFNRWIMARLHLSASAYSRFLAPVVEETVKALYLVYLLGKKRIGFMVDAAILGFAIGAGFSMFENIVYLRYLSDSNPIFWVIRGFGTAIMHGGTVSMMGILAKSFSDRRRGEGIIRFLPGLVLAITVHSVFNHLQIHLQFLSSVVFMIGLPLVVLFVFDHSERSLRRWLDVGFGSDVELLEMIRTGTVLKSKLGEYLQSLKDRIPGEILADMLCYLRLFVELSVKAKGILLMTEAGFSPSYDPETKDKFRELKFLEKSIGSIGRRILSPFMHIDTRDLWQLHMLERRMPARSKPE